MIARYLFHTASRFAALAARDPVAASATPAAAAALLAVTIVLLGKFFRTALDDPPRVEAHWGGLGGGLGGWRISPSLAYLFAALMFAAMFTSFTTRWLLREAPAECVQASAPIAAAGKAAPATDRTPERVSRNVTDSGTPPVRRGVGPERPDSGSIPASPGDPR